MYQTKTVQIKMDRGGYMPLVVEGRVFPNSDGSGQTWTDVEIHSVFWPGGGVVAEKNIADEHQVEDAFYEKVKHDDRGDI